MRAKPSNTEERRDNPMPGPEDFEEQQEDYEGDSGDDNDSTDYDSD